MCIVESVLADRGVCAVDQFNVHCSTKAERSSERLRLTVSRERVAQPKSRSLDAAAVKQSRGLLLDNGTAVENHGAIAAGPNKVSAAASGKGDRQSLKQLEIMRVSHSVHLFGFIFRELFAFLLLSSIILAVILILCVFTNVYTFSGISFSF